MALKVRTIKLDDETWEGWQAEAGAIGVSLTELIKRRMRAPDSTSAQKMIDAKNAEIEALEVIVARLNGKYVPNVDAYAPKPVAAVLPVTGTEFPQRPVYPRGQGKGKGKRS